MFLSLPSVHIEPDAVLFTPFIAFELTRWPTAVCTSIRTLQCGD
jgi:hypothetical protein